MKNFLIESWKEYISFFKSYKTNKKKFFIIIVLFEIIIFILSAYILVNVFKTSSLSSDKNITKEKQVKILK